MPQGHIVTVSPKASLSQEITRHKLITGFHQVNPFPSSLARETSCHFTKYYLRQNIIYYEMEIFT